MVGKSRMVMVLSYLESIEDPYQYGDNYGDLVEYLKMLIEGEEEYVPEENKFTLSWMQKDELVNWEDIRGTDIVDILQSGLLGEANHVNDMRLTESHTGDSWIYDSKHKYFTKENKSTKWSSNEKDFFEKHSKDIFNFSPQTLKWIEDNAVEPERTKHGIIIEGSFDREDFLSEEDQAIWGLNPYSIQTTWELNEGRVDELTKKLNDIREETDLAKEEYAHARWKKGYKNKEFHAQIQAMLHRFKQY